MSDDKFDVEEALEHDAAVPQEQKVGVISRMIAGFASEPGSNSVEIALPPATPAPPDASLAKAWVDVAADESLAKQTQETWQAERARCLSIVERELSIGRSLGLDPKRGAMVILGRVAKAIAGLW